MRNIDPILDALKEEAIAQVASIRAYRTYQGENPEYRQRAKLAIGVIGAYVRLRATLANERTNDLVELRLVGKREIPKLVGATLDEPQP